MGNWSKVLVLLAVITIGVGFGGYMYYKNSYVKPRVEITKKREELQTAITNVKTSTTNIEQATKANEGLFVRSFPRNRAAAALQYEMWLSQMLEFCNISDAQVSRLEYSVPQNSGLAIQNFRVQGVCRLIDLSQFLYEFYWTSFLHRISTLDIQPVEGSSNVSVTMVIQGLTILYRMTPNQQYPLMDRLPDLPNPQQQLASGPFAAYRRMADMDIFRAVQTGIDQTALVFLSGVPTITDDLGESVTVSRWNNEAEGKTISLKVGEELRIGSFEATIADIDENIVVLRQKSGALWVVPLGYKLSEALAVPPNLF